MAWTVVELRRWLQSGVKLLTKGGQISGTADGARTRTSKAEEYLQLLRSLAVELDRAMQAISSNNLGELEDSISSQQDLSARLSQLATELKPVPPFDIFTELREIPRARFDAGDSRCRPELQELNLRYSYLLQFSSRSVGLMASLFNSFNGQLKEASATGRRLQTWSCQV